MRMGHELGLQNDEMLMRLDEKEHKIDATIAYLRSTSIAPAVVNPILAKKEENPIAENETLVRILRRTNITTHDIVDVITDENIRTALLDTSIAAQVEIDTKYEGYIQRQNEQIVRFAAFEEMIIPEHFDFRSVPSLSAEGKDKLSRVRPRSIGQASRIAGVTNADVSVLSIFLKQTEASRHRST